MSADDAPLLRDPGTIYGRIITGATVERAALQTIRKYAPQYIRETCRQVGRDPLPDPRGYIVALTFDKWPEDQLPVVVVISPGWAGRPRRAGDGRALAPWSLAAGIVSSATPERTRENAQLYLGAIRTLLVQQQALGGLAAGIDCLDEDYIPPFAFSRTRTLLAVQALFTVHVSDAFTYGAGPPLETDGPPPDPTEPPNWPVIRRTDVRLVLTADPASEEE